jgi:hypothetical protein
MTLPTAPVTTGSLTTPFADSLQNITDLITGLNAQPGNPNNGSSIGQIRTNEISFDPGSGAWEMRQFNLTPCGPSGCQLAQSLLPQTPVTPSVNSSNGITSNVPALDTFLINNQATLATSRHVVPTNLLAASSLSSTSVAVQWENNPNPVTSVNFTGDPTKTSPNDIRHNFAFSTCNGCHYIETANQNGHFHIGPRNATATATVSQFVGLANSLVSSDGGNKPVNAIAVPDIADPNMLNEFNYNEPWRRACEIRRILDGSTTSWSTTTGHN